MPGGLGVAAHHQDVDGAARVTGAAGPPLAAVDEVLVALALDARGDVGGVAGGDLGLGHRETAADLAGQQGLEPAFLLLGRAVARQHLHIAGVGGAAVEDLAGPQHMAHALGQRRVLGVAEAGAKIRVG
jgi:hypothetical protein